jgi:SAM-dependent methyltransferase
MAQGDTNSTHQAVKAAAKKIIDRNCEHEMTTERNDLWSVGDAYERYVGRWSRIVAGEFLDWLGVRAGGHWLDVGCGTGILSESILDRAAPQSVVGIDQSDSFVAHAGSTQRDSRVEFRVGNAHALPFDNRSFDAAVSGLVINFVPDMAKAVSEMGRVTRPGGTVAAYVWDYAGEMQMMRRFWDAAVALNSDASDMDEGRRFPVCHPEPLAGLFKGAGLTNVETRAIDIPTVFKDFDDFWTPFLGGQGPAPGYCMSLSASDRFALREKLRPGLVIQNNGTINMSARAWAVRGRA